MGALIFDAAGAGFDAGTFANDLPGTASTPFTSGSGGYNTYRIPALTLTPSGVLVAFAEGRVNSAADYGNIDIVCRRSTDGGTTWSAPQVVTQHGGDTAGNPCVMTDPTTGTITLLSCRNGPNDTSTLIKSGKAPPRRIYVQRSTNDGATWTTPTEISAQVRPAWMRGYATGPGHGVVTATGRLVAPCFHSKIPTGTDTGAELKYYGAHTVLSDDGGITWRIGGVSNNPDGYINETETTVCTLPDGRLYFNLRDQDGTSPGTRADAYSSDGGQTLELAYRTQATIRTSPVQGSVITLPDGRLLLSIPDDPDRRVTMALWISDDAGRTWRVVRRISGLPAAYSDMVLLGDDVGLIYETGDYGSSERIEFIRIPLAELGG